MKKFIINLTAIGFLLFGLVFTFEIIYSKSVMSNSDFLLDSSPKYIVLGHSHAASSYNDSIIDNFKNLAASGESYFYTYHKTKEIIKQNASIKTVFIEFSNNSIDEKMDSWTWGDVDMSFRFERFAPMISIQDKLYLLFKNPSCYFNTLSVIFEERIDQVLQNELSFKKKIGGFAIQNSNKNNELVIDNNKSFDENYKISTVNLEYLDQIIAMCQFYGKRVVLIRSPQRDDYVFWKNETMFQKILKEKYGNIEFLDFSRFELKADEYLNSAHLSYEGAMTYSKWFNKVLDQLELKDASADK